MQFVQKLFDTFINYIDRLVITFENNYQVFYIYMKIFHAGTNFGKPHQKSVG